MFEHLDGVAPHPLALGDIARDLFEALEFVLEEVFAFIPEDLVFEIAGALQADPGASDLRYEHQFMVVRRLITADQVVASAEHGIDARHFRGRAAVGGC